VPDRITYFTNAWESTAPSGLSDVATTLTVADASALNTPCYIVIDPDDPSLREYLWVDTKSGNDLPILGRNQPGSVGQVAHAANAVVRSIATSMAFTDLHDRVTTLASVVAAQDPSGVYLPLSGGTMSAAIAMGNNKITGLGTPSNPQDAANKTYVDARETAITAAWQQGDVNHLASGDPHGQYLTEAAAGTTYLPLSGGVMTGTLNMSGEVLSNPADPTAGFHVGDRAYNDARYLGISDNAASATKLNTARTIDITGDITATAVAFDGTANIAISAAVNNDSHTHDTRYYTESEMNTRLDQHLGYYSLEAGSTNPRTIQVTAGSGPPSGGSSGDIVFYY
jgi:hypothetical protein